MSHSMAKLGRSDLDLLFGFRAGLGLDYHLNEMLYLSTALDYHLAGAEDVPDQPLESFYELNQLSEKDYSIEGTKIKSHALSIPFNLGVNLPFNFEDCLLSVEGGPYLAYILSTKAYVVKAKNSVSLDKELKPGLSFSTGEGIVNDALSKYYQLDNLNHLEMGLGLALRLSTKSFYARLGANFGLTNMYKDKANTLRNRDYYITVGFSL